MFSQKRTLFVNLGPRMSRKNDSKNQNDGQFLQRKGPYLANDKRLKKQATFENKSKQIDGSYPQLAANCQKRQKSEKLNDKRLKKHATFEKKPKQIDGSFPQLEAKCQKRQKFATTAAGKAKPNRRLVLVNAWGRPAGRPQQ